jgi:hypothetical protein
MSATLQDLQKGLKDVVMYLDSLDFVHLETAWRPFDVHDTHEVHGGALLRGDACAVRVDEVDLSPYRRTPMAGVLARRWVLLPSKRAARWLPRRAQRGY